MRILRYGSTGPAVQLLQLALNRAGFGPLDTDGIFGWATGNALLRFQRSRRLEADAAGGARNVAVVTHAGTLRNVLQYVIGLPYKQGVLMSASNCSLNLLEYRDGGWRILAWNYLPALPRDAARAE